jgi:hypothetical protein
MDDNDKVKRLIEMPQSLWDWARQYGNATAYIVKLLREDKERNAAKAAERRE